MYAMSMQTMLVTLLLLLAVLGIVAYVAPLQSSSVPAACTMEAKLCPDGSYVGRTGPTCEFAQCPTATSTGSTDIAPVVGAGEHCGGFIKNAPICAAGYHCQLFVSRPDTGGSCVADSSSGGGGGILLYHSGVRGTVMLGPTCPVERMPPDPQCADKAFSTRITIFRSSDLVHEIAVTQSDAQGAFEVSLAPGDYTVRAGNPGTMLPRCTPTSITVGPNAYSSVTVSCDSGIR